MASTWASFAHSFEPMAIELQMQWRLKVMSEVPRVAVFVSQYLHCLVDILHRQQAGELHCTIPLVIGNHRSGEALAKFLRHRVSLRPGDAPIPRRKRRPSSGVF